MKTLICTLSCLLFTVSLLANNVTALSSDTSPGDWNDATTWSGGRVPASGDVVSIPLNNGVTVKGLEYSTPLTLTIQVWGTLHFEPSGKLDLTSLSQVQLFLGGKIVPKNASSSQLITIGGVTKYNAANNGTVDGPAIASALSGVSVSGQPMSGFDFGTPLPVVLTTFSAEETNGDITVKWETTQETNIEQFVVEQSDDNINWRTAATITAKGIPSAYTFIGHPGARGNGFFRLKTVYVDHHYDYSSIIKLTRHTPGLVVSPNPSSGLMTVSLPANRDDKIKISLVTFSGRVIKIITTNGTQSSFQLDLQGLAKGNYFVFVEGANGETSRQLIVLQ